MATVAELVARLRADTSNFVAQMKVAEGSLATTQAAMTRTGASATALGKKMSTNVSLPLAAIGAVAIKSALDFEKAMTDMAALVGVPAEQLAIFEDQIMELGPALGKSPQELAEGLYFITSAGLSGAAAMEALEAAAKASAVGLGETEVVADAITSAINAYGGEVITAEQATSTLVGAVRLGKAEADEFAGSIGRVIPVASQMGISFDQVAAAMSSMTLLGVDADEAATALRGTMTSFLSPSIQAEEALARVGLSAEGMRDMIEEQGLLAALTHLDTAFEGNVAAMAEVFPNVRALTGVMNLVGENAEAVQGIFDQLASGTDYLGDAMTAVAETDGYKMKQAMAEVQVALIALGDTIVPLAADAANAMATITSGFTAMPGPAQGVVAAMGGILIATGPVLRISGALMTNWGSMANAAKNLTAPLYGVSVAGRNVGGMMSNLSGALKGAGGAAAGAAVAFTVYTTIMNKARDAGKEMAAAQRETTLGLGSYDEAVSEVNRDLLALQENAPEDDLLHRAVNQEAINSYNAMAGGVQELANQLEAIGPQATALAERYDISEQAAADWLTSQLALGVVFDSNEQAMGGYGQAALVAAGMSEEAATEVGNMGDEYVDAEIAMANAKQALEDWGAAVQAQFDPLFGMLDANAKLTESLQAVTEAKQAVTDAENEFGVGSAESIQATRDLEAANRDLMQANIDLDVAGRNLAQGVRDGSVSLLEAQLAIDGWADAGRMGAEEAANLKWQMELAAAQADDLDAHSPLVTVDADITAFEAKMAQVFAKRAMALIPAVMSVFGEGGLVSSPTVGMVGEDGPELILPLSKPQRMATLLSSMFSGGGAGVGGGADSAGSFGGGGGGSAPSRSNVGASRGAQTNVFVGGEQVEAVVSRKQWRESRSRSGRRDNG